jgi:hypothetical protein
MFVFGFRRERISARNPGTLLVPAVNQGGQKAKEAAFLFIKVGAREGIWPGNVKVRGPLENDRRVAVMQNGGGQIINIWGQRHIGRDF